MLTALPTATTQEVCQSLSEKSYSRNSAPVYRPYWHRRTPVENQCPTLSSLIQLNSMLDFQIYQSRSWSPENIFPSAVMLSVIIIIDVMKAKILIPVSSSMGTKTMELRNITGGRRKKLAEAGLEYSVAPASALELLCMSFLE